MLEKHRNQKPQTKNNFKNVLRHLRERRKVLNGFGSKSFPKKQTQRKRRPSMLVKVADRLRLLDLSRVANVSDRSYLEIFSPKPMIQRLPVTLVQVKTGNTYENLLKEIRRSIYSLYRAKEFTEKVYNNVHCTKNEVFH